VEKIAGDGSRGQIVCVLAKSSNKARTVVDVIGEDTKSQNPNGLVGDKKIAGLRGCPCSSLECCQPREGCPWQGSCRAEYHWQCQTCRAQRYWSCCVVRRRTLMLFKIIPNKRHCVIIKRRS
jgi:hypothetical protein